MFSLYGSANDHYTKKWRGEPKERGTYSILSTCLITLCLCVWTAVHLNIPEHKHPRAQWYRKVGWLLMGVFAPEIVAYTAYYQYAEARKLDQFMKEKGVFQPSIPKLQRIRRWFRRSSKSDDMTKDDCEAGNNARSRRHPWTRVHSIFAVMGGFALDISDAEQLFLPHSLTRLTILPEGLRCLADYTVKYLPDILKEEIRDKSKANGLAKAIVCIQAFWFCVQCIVRLVQKLPLSLLELNTFVHALCTLVIYGLWWDKPLDVNEPTIVQSTELHELWALFSISGFSEDNFTVTHPCGCPLGAHYTERRKEFLKFNVPGSFPQGVNQGTPRTLFKLHCDQPLYGCYLPSRYLSWKERDKCACRYGGQETFDGLNPSKCPSSIYTELTAADILRIKLASNAAGQIHRSDRSSPVDTEMRSELFKVFDDNRPVWVARRIRNWPDTSVFHDLKFFEGMKPKPVTVGLSLASLIYGLLHLSAWGAQFRSQTEMLLWWISSITLVAAGPVIAVVNVLSCLHNWLDNIIIFTGRVAGRLFRTATLLCVSLNILFMTLYSLLYCFSRIYLVLECFFGLTYLPETIYRLPELSRYFPHIS